jgi:hypothetical protein
MTIVGQIVDSMLPQVCLPLQIRAIVEKTMDIMYHTFVFLYKEEQWWNKEQTRCHHKSVLLYKEVKCNNIKFCSFELMHVQISIKYINPKCIKTLE